MLPFRNLLFASALVAAPGAVGPAHPDSDSALPIVAGAWFNHIGQPISIDSLKGSAVLVEIWATW